MPETPEDTQPVAQATLQLTMERQGVVMLPCGCVIVDQPPRKLRIEPCSGPMCMPIGLLRALAANVREAARLATKEDQPGTMQKGEVVAHRKDLETPPVEPRTDLVDERSLPTGDVL